MLGLRSLFVAFWLAFVSLAAAETSMQLNYYTDHYCKNYVGSVPYGSGAPMSADTAACWNFQYGNSVLISDCYNRGFCICLLYSQTNCAGDYASIQYSGYDKNKYPEYNCIFNGNTRKSMKCYYW